MDGDGFGGDNYGGGDSYSSNNDTSYAATGSSSSTVPSSSQPVQHPPPNGGDDGDGSLDLGGLPTLGNLLGPQGFGLHVGADDGGNNLPSASAAGIGLEISGANGDGSLLNASADDSTLLDVGANGPAPDTGIDIGIFADAPEGDGLINVASGGDSVLEIGAGEGGLPNNDPDAASLDVSAAYDPSTGVTIDAAVSGDNPDTGLLGGLISDGDSFAAASPVLDLLDQVAIG